MEEFESQSCLFCTNCFDRKPDINCVEVEAFENFKGGFNLFCKLLGVDCDWLVSDNGGGSHPSCEECFEALRNLVKLEKIIVETRERQTEVVQILRAVMVASADSVPKVLNRWAQLREHLVKALQTPETERDKSSIHSNDYFDDNFIDSEGVDYSHLDVHEDGDKQSVPEIKNCRVSLTRISLPLKPTIGASPIVECAIKPEVGVDDSTQMDYSIAPEPIMERKKGRGRPPGGSGRRKDKASPSGGGAKRKPEVDMADMNFGKAETTTKRGKGRPRGSSAKGVTSQTTWRKPGAPSRSCSSATKLVKPKTTKPSPHPRGGTSNSLPEAAIHLDERNDSTIVEGIIGGGRRFKRERVSYKRKKSFIEIACGQSSSESSDFEEKEVNVYRTKRDIEYLPSGSEEVDEELQDSEDEMRVERKRNYDEIKNSYNSNVTEVYKRSWGRCVGLTGFDKRKHCHQGESDDLFLRLRDDLFLHKNILVAFTQRKFVCQENDCSYETSESLSEANCLIYDLFEEFRKHVNESHKVISKHLTQTCPLCPKTFDAQRHLFKAHLIEEHSLPMICNSCWRPFHGKGVVFMMRHAWSHKNEEEKEFAKSLGYQPKEMVKRKRKEGSGKRLDPSEKNIFCDQCPQRFATAGGLKAHQKKHHLQDPLMIKKTETDCRKFECRFCGRQYPVTGKSQWERHMRTHSDDFSFVCEICGKGFVSKERLKLHANVHSEEPQFPCEFCDRKYKHPRNLHLHMQKEHSEMLEILGKGKRKEFIGPKIAFPCEFCDRIFPFRGPWANHVRKEHADKQGMSELKVESKS